MDSGNGVVSYKRDNWRLLEKDFKLKSIKEKGKFPFWQFKQSST